MYVSTTRFSRKLVTAVALVSMPLSAASAAVFPPFTLNPAAAGLIGGQFSADNIVVSDFSTIAYTSGTATTARNFTDNGFLPVSNFQTSGAFATSPGLNSNGGYGLYFQFAGTGVQNAPNPDGSVSGSFTNISFKFYGFNQTTPPNYSPDGVTVSGVVSPVLLATGSALNGSVFINPTANGPIPGASALVQITPVPSVSAFFVSPNPFYLNLTTSFTNTFTAIAATDTGFTITNGGGQANFLAVRVPEPASILVVSAGFGLLGLLRRRTRP